MPTNRSVLVVEDDAKLANTIKLYLEREAYDVSVAHNGRDALRLARDVQPDLIILDLMLPQINGMDVCRILRTESDVYIIMLTARATEPDKLAGLDSGADDYVTKPFSPRELMARVRAVMRRKRPEHTGGLRGIQMNDLLLNLDRRDVSLKGRPVSLTPAEFNLLEAFVRSPERVFTRQELVERAFGYDYEGLDRTVDAHIMNLRKKIEPDRRQPSFIVTVYGIGYRFRATRNDS